jgi:hypothetical protein
MGAYGLLTILGVKDNDGKFSDKPTTKEQLNKMLQEWRSKWSGDSKRGSVAITNKSAEWTPFGLSVQDFKPSIKAKIVWDAIFEEAGYTYSSSFIDNGGFDDVYLLCNRALKYPIYSGIDLENYGVIKVSPISGSGQTDLNIPQSTNTNLPWYNVEKDPSNVIGTNSSYTINLQRSSSLECTINLSLSLSGSIGGPNISVILRDTGSLAVKSSTTLITANQFFNANTFNMFAEGTLAQNRTFDITEQFSTGILAPGTYYFGLEWIDQFNAPYNNFTFILDKDGKPKSYLEITKLRQGADGRVLDVALNMPYGTRGIKQIDFLTSIQKKFNLVMYPSKTVRNEFIVETFNNWYNTGRRWDFNKFVNLNEKIEVIPANNLAVNELDFGDTLDQDYISQQFAKGANREYGKSYYVDQENFFSQGKFEVKTALASSPLLYLTGTGLSGSVEGLNPVIEYYYAGEIRYGISRNASDTCFSPARIQTYTSTGYITSGQIVYSDQYGANPIRGLYFILDPSSLEVYDLNPSTGEIGFGTGYFC